MVRIVHTTIGVPFEQAYEFACKPENFPKWAAGMSKSLQHTSSRGWVGDTPAGEAVVKFSDRNDMGVLDHWVSINGKEIYIPLRMLKNGANTEVELVLFRQPDMTDKMYDDDHAHVKKDLATLKSVLENRK